MRQAGEVTYADAHKPRRNEGCVEFASERVSHFIKYSIIRSYSVEKQKNTLTLFRKNSVKPT